MKRNIESIARKSVQNLTPYSSAREEFKERGNFIFLDANERACDPKGEDSLNRYPDPRQTSLRSDIAKYNNIPVENIFIGNGSDEAIELLIEIFCEPGVDEIIITPPTYGMYQVCADAHGAITKKAPLTEEFKLDFDLLKESISEKTKIIFICSPNNPTGNAINQTLVLSLLEVESFNGIIVVDEAYVEFCPDKSFIKYIFSTDRLVILRTFSKAWGLAGARVGMAFGSSEVISLMMRKKPPYNVSTLSQSVAIEALRNSKVMEDYTAEIISMRNDLSERISSLKTVKVYDSDSNFILVKFKDAEFVYKNLLEKGLVVRNRSKEFQCENTLRITIGNRYQNEALFNALKEIIEGE